MHREVLIGVVVTVIAAAAGVRPALADGPYKDGPTSEWFAGLASPYTQHCCDQADCHIAMSDYHDGAWWALSNRTGTWVKIMPNQITSTVSIFKDAVLCEGDPLLSTAAGASGTSGPPQYEPRVYCFAPPPIGF